MSSINSRYSDTQESDIRYQEENGAMAEIESLYQKEDGKVIIGINLSSLAQLYNSFDPAPFHEKELDRDAEQYIVDTVNDLPAKTEFRLVIHLPPELMGTREAGHVIPAIRHHFEYRMLVADRKFRARFRHGRWAMLIGFSFLAIALVARQLVTHIDNHLAGILAADALLIIGWAAMWEPVTVILYELWPILQLKKTYGKISRMEIEIRPSPPDGGAAP
jgi:hypothetical protein